MSPKNAMEPQHGMYVALSLLSKNPGLTSYHSHIGLYSTETSTAAGSMPDSQIWVDPKLERHPEHGKNNSLKVFRHRSHTMLVHCTGPVRLPKSPSKDWICHLQTHSDP